MRIFKGLFVLILVFLSAISLFACHGAEETLAFEIPNGFDTEKEYKVVFWAKNENNSSQREVYEKAISDFESYYPNIKVTIKHFTSYDDIYNDVITNIQTGTTPNVCITYPDHIATYITGENVVVPLDDLITDAKYGLGGSAVRFDAPTMDEIVPEYLDEGYIGATLYALPFMRSTEACYINKTYVEALGYEVPDILTWDFIFEVSNAALAKDGEGNYRINGQNVMIPFIYKSTDNMMIQMLRQKGAGYSTSTGKIEIFNDTTKEILKTVAENTKTGAFSTFKISSYPANFLNKGQCIFAVDSTAGATWMGSDAPLSDVHHGSVIDFETVVRPVPQYDVNDPQMISQGPSLCIFNKEDPGEVMASWLFVQYLLSNETQISYSQTEGYVPVTEKAQNSSEYQDYLSRSGEDNDLYYDVKIAATKMLIDNTDNTFTAPVFNGSTSLRNAAGELIEDVTKAVNRKKNVNDKYIDRLYSDVTALYRLDQIEAMEGKIRLDEMPVESIALLSGIGVAWLGIITYACVSYFKKQKR
nr:extracellular solute-binding protein [Oscillospiraceae bacterium]